MQRYKKVKSPNGLRRIVPKLLWRQCCICEKEFIKEYGWRFRMLDWYETNTKYICQNCAETEEEAIEIVNKINRHGINRVQDQNEKIRKFLNPEMPPKPPIYKRRNKYGD